MGAGTETLGVGTGIRRQRVRYPARVPEERTYGYRAGDGSELQLDVVRPDSEGPARGAPAVVFFHGGAWRIGSREQFLPQCRRLAQVGIAGITASYRLVTDDNGLSPVDCVTDARLAVAWVREHASELGIDPARIGAGGGSAGGHLAAALASMKVDLCGLVLFNPALAPDGTPRLAFMGDAGPDWDVHAGFPPALVLHGTADEIVPIENARAFQEHMVRLGRRCELIAYEGMPHAFFNYPAPAGRFEETVAQMLRFLAELGASADRGSG